MSRQITMAEVKKHNTAKSLWVVIYNSVYDLTTFIEEHPGGGDVLIESGGLDATIPFEDVGHSSDAREMMKKYKIGDLIIEKPKHCLCIKKFIPHGVLALAIGIALGYGLRRFFRTY